MVRISVLADALKTMYNAEKVGLRKDCAWTPSCGKRALDKCCTHVVKLSAQGLS